MTLALPNFRKLYRKLIGKIEKATYLIEIDYSLHPCLTVHDDNLADYPVSSFSGEKHVVLSSNTWIGLILSFL
jgi:hypothetical protein